jgi:CubicO group peptidase (beta-lactamase class C family)
MSVTRISLMAMLMLSISIATSSARAANIPDTFAGDQLRQFIDAFNSGDENVWREYVLNDPIAADSAAVFDRRFESLQFLYSDLGGMNLLEVTRHSQYAITALMQAVHPQGPFEFVSVSLEYDAQPPHSLLGIGVRPADNPNEELPEGDFSDASVRQFLDSYIDDQVARDRFSGAVLVAYKGKPVYTRAAGAACKRYDVPNKLDTKFNLGSMNKMFTGVAIAQLAEQGKLNFTDTVGEYLPDYPNGNVRNKVTIHQLLTHTAGLGDYFSQLWETKFWLVRTVKDYAKLFWKDSLLFEPGSEMRYSNAGPIVLGLIIEAVTGMSYYDYVSENIYAPAGMTNTGCYEVDLPVKNLAIGYTHYSYDETMNPQQWRNNYFLHAVRGGPAGGGFSTVEDLLKFANALFSYKLLGKPYVDTVTTGKVEMDGPELKYAYLFGDHDFNGHRAVGHTGGAPGINAVLEIFVDDGYTVAVMSNYDGGAMPIARKIRKFLTRDGS